MRLQPWQLPATGMAGMTIVVTDVTTLIPVAKRTVTSRSVTLITNVFKPMLDFSRAIQSNLLVAVRPTGCKKHWNGNICTCGPEVDPSSVIWSDVHGTRSQAVVGDPCTAG